MAWSIYRVVLRLLSPLHIGWGKISYLQRVRPYVTGRVLRGALINRVGRNQNIRGDDPRDPFRCVSKTFSQYLTFTYFYPALKNGDNWQAQFPWDDGEANFRRRFLSSYAGTALVYPQQAAAEGLLREIEFIAPHTLDEGKPVYLMGYVFAKEACLRNYNWRGAFERLQLGGERGYGWGEARSAIEPKRVDEGDTAVLFGQTVGFAGSGNRPRLRFAAKARTWSHVLTTGAVSVSGPIEPLVGREWRANQSNKQHIGQYLAFNNVCYVPGSLVKEPACFIVGEAGIWQQQAADFH